MDLLTSLAIINIHKIKVRFILMLSTFYYTTVILAFISTPTDIFVCCFQGGLILLVLVLLFKIAHKNVSRTLAVEVGGETTIYGVLPGRILTVISNLCIPAIPEKLPVVPLGTFQNLGPHQDSVYTLYGSS